ncbi:PH domain-containing protein [Chryseobacterium salivictor]|uniref:Bacterial Pleckstrin homology domain-containing protein n=1 Tax=Chryseobacterium salivictor TaxID=2547600 RepID=A0A4P6ZHK0_9FLAO|nr:PH domain-containing protein [Chryseobacterium salivictor]QBO59129.1 hypothetical protein NBC122_02324 [Chryseobacterium salivictor]
MKEFVTAKMDDRTKIFTLILLVLLPLLALSSFFMQPPKPVVSVVLTILLFSVIVISYGLVPKRIAISDDQILIRNLFGAVIININEIKTADKIEKTGLNLRTFGVGGLFGYFGYFNGRDVWYVTNIHKKVKMILKSGKIYMISPENPDNFLQEVHRRMSEMV